MFIQDLINSLMNSNELDHSQLIKIKALQRFSGMEILTPQVKVTEIQITGIIVLVLFKCTQMRCILMFKMPDHVLCYSTKKYIFFIRKYCFRFSTSKFRFVKFTCNFWVRNFFTPFFFYDVLKTHYSNHSLRDGSPKNDNSDMI